MYTVKKKQTRHKKRSYRTDTVSRPLIPLVALPNGIIALVGWQEPLFRYQCLYSVSLQRESNADYNSVTNKYSEFDPYVTTYWASPKWASRVGNKMFLAP